MQVFHALKHVFRVELFFEVMIGLQREPAFVTDLFKRGGDGREINGHGERDLVGIVPPVVIVNVKRLQAVAQLDMKIEKGHLYGLIGPNGAGKTTVFNMLTGVYRPTEGDIILDGVNITGKKPEKICRAGIARTFQNIRLFNELTVLDNVKVGLHNQVRYAMWTGIFRLPGYREKEREMNKQAMKLLKIFDLDKEARLPASSLPYGKQRKLEIARALATNPKLLLLDEPAAGMNPNETEELMNTIKSVRETFGVAILLIEHDMNFVMGICEHITVLDYGRIIAEGNGEAIRNNPKVIAAYLGGD